MNKSDYMERDKLWIIQMDSAICSVFEALMRHEICTVHPYSLLPLVLIIMQMTGISECKSSARSDREPGTHSNPEMVAFFFKHDTLCEKLSQHVLQLK